MKKGFTLIELLAVIVILAIIALIAVPTVINIIDNANLSAKERSAANYLNAVNNAIAKFQLNNVTSEIESGYYTVNGEGNLCKGNSTSNDCDDELIIELDGDKPSEGSKIYIDGNQQISNAYLNISNYNVVKDETSTSKIQTTLNKTYPDGTAVYFNVTTGEKCEQSAAVSAKETKSGCMKFYAFGDSDTSATLKLILDHNTSTGTNFNDSFNDSSTKESKLKQDTASWTGTLIQEETNYKARAITIEEVKNIMAMDEDTYEVDKPSDEKFLWENINDYDTFGYWILKSSNNQSDSELIVFENGSKYKITYVKANVKTYGVRPVIEVAKYKLD